MAGFRSRLLALLLLLLLLPAIIKAEDCRRTEKGLDYVGRVDKTVTGKTCLKWSGTARCYTGLAESNPVDTVNFCRNPRGFGDCQLLKPWCYTTDDTREYCDVPVCGYKEPACSHALGMENGDIADSQITATSSMSGHEPSRARLNSGNADGRAGWVASTVDENQHLKIDLKTLHNVTKVILQGSDKATDAWTKQFKVQYSEDGKIWSLYKQGLEVKLFEGNPAHYHGISHTFDPPLRTRFFVVIPTMWNNRPGLRLEVHGCAAAEDRFFSDEIGGTVVSDMTIRARETPYVVNRSIVVSENASLTIEAGVTLLFNFDRGVLVKGTLNLQGRPDKFIYFNRSSPRVDNWLSDEWGSSWRSWAGITIEKSSRMNDLCISNVAISGSSVGLRVKKDGVVKIRNCRFSKNNKGLQLLSVSANVTVTNSEFHNNDFGIDFVDRGTLAIRGCKFTQQHKTAINGSPDSSRRTPETVYISDNAFANNRGSINLVLSKSTNLRLVRNTFEKERALTWCSVCLTVSHCELTVQGNDFLRIVVTALGIMGVNSHTLVRNNTWKYGGQTIGIRNLKTNQTTIEENVFHANDGGIALWYGGNATVRITSNVFTKNRGKTVIMEDTWNIHESSIITPLEIDWNLFSMNSVDLGVIHAIEPCVIHSNTFNNPNSSHDFLVGDFAIDGVMERSDAIRGVTNATYNWWGVATRSGVAKRIRIEDEWVHDVGRHTVEFEPFLTHRPQGSCSKVNNCSNHGECVLPDTCVCHSGWAGPRCDRCSDNYVGPRCLPSTATPKAAPTTTTTPTATTTTTTTTLTTTTPDMQKPTTTRMAEQTACYVVDIAFTVDAAGSIVRENWSRMTSFFDRFVSRMDVSRNCARVSIVTFGNAATLQFGLRAYNNAGSLRLAVERLDERNQSRNFADGIKKVRSEVFQDHSGDRKDAPNMCIIITDGTSGVEKQKSLAEASRAKADGINLHVIGIGKNVRMSELSSMASTEAIHLNDFADLNGNEALQKLYSFLECFKQTPAPTTTTSTTTTTTTEQPTTTSDVKNNFWQCSFEGATGRGSLCGMTQSSSDNFDWTLRSGATPSSETGPNSGYGGSGYYIFIEASDPRRTNDTAMIMLPSFNRDGVYCLSFHYNMNGYHINTLQVVKRAPSGQLVNLWMKKSNQGPQWHAAKVTANLYSTEQLAFIGIRGAAFSGDIAVDNVSVRWGRCKV